MIWAMILAHLIGDYVLQWNQLAAWKSRALGGVTIHCLVLFSVTWLLALPFDPFWWGIFFISGSHFVIDALQLRFKPALPPLGRFLLDQVAHFTVIGTALFTSGYWQPMGLIVGLQQFAQNEYLLLILIGYAFVTMPAWVIIKFVVYGLVNGSGPEFGGTSKYLGIVERLLMTTFVALGQFLLLPFVAAPRLALEWREIRAAEKTAVYLAEWLISVLIAVSIGLWLSLLTATS